ncbi:N-acetyl-gamma-glutamyl-phosphate reductase [uncultured Ruminococcus sp.]|uniref:N-acetyl-gamma-glutamyl-phosphate reductase n=1 Tax=uncultured Ruminococcus sp. TaxID=165186 RepID=UPI0025EFE75C|nr:N-acetyl-gamma-glutamyl-phosphate reductase [uncultured Ruminococcus sp.]
MKKKVFIDGKAGTTGLKIYERLGSRDDIEILLIDEDKRKDVNERARLINSADIVFLCLPDDAAREAAALCTNPDVRIIDASTAHRTSPDWDYGFPELSEKHRENIRNSKRVANPGCYASGFISLVYPLVQAGVLPEDYPITCHAVSGYSGAGNKAIAVMESSDKTKEMYSPRQYALGQTHKHLPEMQKVCGLKYAPMFNPIVDDYFSGMVVSVPLITRCLTKKYTPADIHEIMSAHYAGQHFVKVMELGGTETLPDGFLAANTLADTNNMQIFVTGNDDRILLCSRFDNLGKGASGAAVQSMNIMLGIDEATGLE